MGIIKAKQKKLDGINTIAILADCGCVRDWEEHFPGLLAKVWQDYKPQLFIVVGDISLQGSFLNYRMILKYMNNVSADWIAVPGNHDRPLLVFRKYFGAVRKVIDIGKWRFIGLNTAEKKFTERNARWLEKNIRENTIIFSHTPPGIEGWTFYSLPVESSRRFLETVKRNCQMIKKIFFGHIHGLSEKEFMGIPMIVTGGAAKSRVIKNNKYNEDTSLEMIIFDVPSGDIEIYNMK